METSVTSVSSLYPESDPASRCIHGRADFVVTDVSALVTRIGGDNDGNITDVTDADDGPFDVDVTAVTDVTPSVSGTSAIRWSNAKVCGL